MGVSLNQPSRVRDEGSMDRWFGGPLPRQLPNPTRVHLIPPEFLPLYHAVPWSYAVLAVISNCYPPV